MTYRITKSNGDLLADIPDGFIDESATSLGLIGKNATNFGDAINTNFVKLLENFASTSAPELPLRGQIWYDTATGRLNVFDGTDFRASGGPLISSSIPGNLVPGDLWINNETNQLWFYDGSDLILAGPSYTDAQGKSGIIIESILDNLSKPRVIGKLYINNKLLGIFSNSTFTPYFPIEDFTGNIDAGFSASNVVNRFNVTVSRAESLLTSLGDTKFADDFITNNESGTITGGLTLQGSEGLQLEGASTTGNTSLGQAAVFLENGNLIVESLQAASAIEVRVKTPSGTETAMLVKSLTSEIDFYTPLNTGIVNVNGNLRIAGNLEVTGQTLSINVTNTSFKDHNIELNQPVSPAVATDTTADAGGITLRGTTNKTFNWVNSTSAWTSSEHLNLAPSKEYKINNSTVLGLTTLGTTVTNSSLKVLGNLTTLTMADQLNISRGINITDNVIEGFAGLTLTTVTGDINVSNKKITNLQNLNFVTSLPTDAANKGYVDSQVYRRPVAFSVDISNYNWNDPTGQGLEDARDYILSVLDVIASVYDPVTNPEGLAVLGTVAKIHATSVTVANSPVVYRPVRNGNTPLLSSQTEAYTEASVDSAGGSQNQVVIATINPTQTIPAPAASVVSTGRNLRFVVEQLNVAGDIGWVYKGEIV